MAFPDALKDCETSIKLDPTFVKAYVQKGSTLVSHFFTCLQFIQEFLQGFS